MSRFFRGDGSSDDSEEGSSSEEETTTPKPVAKAPVRYASSSEDEGPVKREVQTRETKIAQEYTAFMTKFKLHIKLNEFTAAVQDITKLDAILQKSTAKGEPTPRAFFKSLCLMEDLVNKANPKANQKALNTFKQRLKKHNTSYAKQMAEYRESPDKVVVSDDDDDEDGGDKDSDDDSDEESEDDKPAPKGKKAAAKPAPATASGGGDKPKYGKSFFTKKAGEESSEDSSDDDDVDLSESESDGSGSDKGGTTNWFLKKADKDTGAQDGKDGKEGKDGKKRGNEGKTPKPPKGGAVLGETVAKEMTAEQVDKKLAELLTLRGKRGTDKQEQMEQLDKLIQFAKSETQLMNVLMHFVSAQFDATPAVATHMPVNLWKGALSNLTKIVTILKANPTLVLTEPEESETTIEQAGEGDGRVIVGNLLAYVERLDDEYIKGLQNIDDPHTNEYVQRLQDEQGFINLVENVQAYYERLKIPKRAARAAFRRLEHLYYKTDKEATAQAAKAANKPAAPTTASGTEEQVAQPNGTAPHAEAPSTSETPAPTETPAASSSAPEAPATVASSSSTHAQLVHELAVIVYQHGDERLRARAMLMHIFHHALHERFYAARDMMLMSHLQENIHQMDIPTQILFNRAMVQLGLCAFRSNLVWEAHSCLADICGVARVKELLAQGVTTRFQDKDKNVEQEKLEKKRQVPFHMHINLELLEMVHLISAMLLEVPNMAANPFDPKRKVISRNFRRLMDYFDRQVFTGPPENNRDHVAAAARALNAGDWKVTEKLLLSLEGWALMPNAEVVKANIRKRIQEEGLRTYLFNYASVYDSISLGELSSMFELEKNHVHSLVSKMMINEELKASWDQPTETIVMHRVEPSKLQYLALQFAEKAAAFAENNDRLLDAKQGITSTDKYSKDPQSKQGGQDRRQDRTWQDGGGYRRQQYGNQYQQKGRDNKDGRDRGDGKHKDGYSTYQQGRTHRGDGYHRNK